MVIALLERMQGQRIPPAARLRCIAETNRASPAIPFLGEHEFRHCCFHIGMSSMFADLKI